MAIGQNNTAQHWHASMTTCGTLDHGKLCRDCTNPFHTYTGGSDINNLAYLRGANIGIVHVNDYPAIPGRDHITDDKRVFPGEGIAPAHALARWLDRIGYHGYLSLEFFRENYAGASAVDVARRGLAAIQKAYTVDQCSK